MKTEAKLQKLDEIFQALGKVVVAFSGGVDSTFLTAAAKRALGGNVLAVTAVSATLTDDEQAEAAKLAEKIGVQHILIETDEFTDALFTANTADRCYFCKKVRFEALVKWAAARGYPAFIGTAHPGVGPLPQRHGAGRRRRRGWPRRMCRAVGRRRMRSGPEPDGEPRRTR